MKKIKTEEAVGQVLCHDITEIIKDVRKGRRFAKGHIIRHEDVPVLLSLGKDHIYVWEKTPGMVHENEAAEFLIHLTRNEYMSTTEVKEGKMELIAERDGLFLVDREKLAQINRVDEVMIASIVGNIPVKKGQPLAGMRVIPLVIDQKKLDRVKDIIGQDKIFNLIPFRSLQAAIITTGNEVYHKRIKDNFTPVIIDKLASVGVEVVEHRISDDDTRRIAGYISEVRSKGVDMIVCTGGMSVDPDDLTPAAIKESGANIITYGAPVLPGAMFLLGYFEDGIPIVGLPGCAMYKKTTIFDLVLPHLVAGVTIDKNYISELGYGGLCMNCSDCHYPNCQFGKGV